MTIGLVGRAIMAGLFLSGLAGAARAEVTRVEIASRQDVIGGKPFGAAGAYEKITGKVFFSVDPAHPRNKAIVDIDKAPRDGAGRVTFSADLYVLAPKDEARRNGAALFDVLNRGRRNIIRDFNRGPLVAEPVAEADFGDGFLMRQGYVLVWLGWQFDMPKTGGLLGLDAPPVLVDGKPVTGLVSTTFTPNTTDPTWPLNDMGRYAEMRWRKGSIAQRLTTCISCDGLPFGPHPELRTFRCERCDHVDTMDGYVDRLAER